MSSTSGNIKTGGITFASPSLLDKWHVYAVLAGIALGFLWKFITKK